MIETASSCNAIEFDGYSVALVEHDEQISLAARKLMLQCVQWIPLFRLQWRHDLASLALSYHEPFLSVVLSIYPSSPTTLSRGGHLDILTSLRLRSSLSDMAQTDRHDWSTTM